jgi:hypothetical protein
MPYSELDKDLFLANYISYEKERKHYFCYLCNKHIIKPKTHMNTIEHIDNEKDIKEIQFKVHF